MPEYIEREIFINNELIPLVKQLDLCHPKQKKGVLMAIQKLNETPTADVVEVKQGKWENSQFIGRSGFYNLRDFICSECKTTVSFLYFDKAPMNYCPKCGARMYGGNAE